jgi:formate hydrogenlyase subunit 3/multisubunit Na+/H+ antiporter MnhD subunit
MTGLEAILPWSPLLIPLCAACAIGLLPGRWVPARRRRWFYLGALFVAAAVLFVARLGAEPTAAFRAFAPWAAYGRAPHLAWDSLALFSALLFVGIYIALGAAIHECATRRLQPLALLVLAAACLGVFAAADLYTLCLMWGLSEVALLCLRVIQAPEEGGRRAIWNTWGGLASTVLLIVAAILTPVSEGLTDWQALSTARAPMALMMAVVVLRIGIPPLSGGIMRHWQAYLASLWMGAVVWLRLIDNAAALPAGLHMAPVGAVLMVLTGLLAALMPDLATALPYAVLNSLSIVLLAPIIAPQEGLAIVLLTVLDLSLAMTLLCVSGQISSFRPLGRWARASEGVALASLMGAPLTPGFLSRWAFMRICLLASLGPLAFCASISFLLVAASAWRRLLGLFAADDALQEEAPWPLKVAAGSGAILALGLVVVGVVPGVLSWVWRGNLGQGLRLAQLFSGEGDILGILVYMAILGPVVGGLSVQHLMRGVPAGATRLLDLFRGVLLLDWLVVLIEEALTRLQLLANRILGAIEASFYLGWSLVWSLTIILFLYDRRI